jgi:heat shock protein HslJ
MRISIILLMFVITTTLMQCKSTHQGNNKNISVENTTWRLMEVNGMPVITPEGSKVVHFALSKKDGERRISGFAGCNTVVGTYKLDENSIAFTAASTRMFCADRMEIEQFFLQTLSATDSYKLNGKILELYQGNVFLAKFEAINP